jgi:hypothetical protein
LTSLESSQNLSVGAFLFSSDEKMRKRVTVKVWSLTPSLSVSDDTVPAQATKEAHLQEL